MMRGFGWTRVATVIFWLLTGAVFSRLGTFEVATYGWLPWRTVLGFVVLFGSWVLLFALYLKHRREKIHEKTEEAIKKHFYFYFVKAISYTLQGRSYERSPTHRELLAGLYKEQSRLIEESKRLCDAVASAIPGQDVDLLRNAETMLQKFFQKCMQYDDQSWLEGLPKDFKLLIEYVHEPAFSGEAHAGLKKELQNWVLETNVWGLTAKRLTWGFKEQIKKQDV